MLSKDSIITDLVLKKKSLLDSLLGLSIRSVVEAGEESIIFKQRIGLLNSLRQNDKAIQTREKQTGIDSIKQEKEIYNDIANLIESISDNNTAVIMRLEQAEKEFEKEKKILIKERNLARYVVQNKTTQIKTKKPSSMNKSTMSYKKIM